MWKWQVKAKNVHLFWGTQSLGIKINMNPFIFHRDTSHYIGLKKSVLPPSGHFAPILTTNTAVKSNELIYPNHFYHKTRTKFFCNYFILKSVNFGNN